MSVIVEFMKIVDGAKLLDSGNWTLEEGGKRLRRIQREYPNANSKCSRT